MKLSVIQSIRTNNFNDEHVMQKIAQLWKEATNRLTENENMILYGVYHEYESNYKGDYSLSVAIEDHHGENMIEIRKDDHYRMFKVDTTEEQGILNAWSNIWEQEEAT